MIDTIVLRLHDIQKHYFIVEQLEAKKTGYSIYKHEKQFDFAYHLDQLEKTGDLTEYKKAVEPLTVKSLTSGLPYLQWKNLEFHDTGKKTKMIMRGHIPSSHYNVAFSLYPDRDFIEFNFSIPKYLYGHNVAQFIDYDKPFFFAKDYYSQKTLVYKRLMNFIKFFFNREFVINTGQWILDWKKLEINRIDLCYNQLFNSKADALEYLDNQKLIKKRASRKQSNNSRDFGTAITYITKRYSCKIYHKGVEFTKHDYKELEKINKQLGYEKFNLIEIQRLADRTLRYEMTIRNTYMSYVYQSKLFRRNCPEMKKLKKDAKIGRSYEKIYFMEVYDIKSPEFQKLSNRKKSVYFERIRVRNSIGISVMKFYIEQYKLWKHIRDKARTFRMRTLRQQKYYNEITEPYQYTGDELRLLPEVRFNEKLLLRLFTKFEEFVKEYEVKNMSSINETIKKLEEVNKQIETQNLINNKKTSKHRPSKLRNLVALLKFFTLDELIKKNYISRTTAYRYKTLLEKVDMKGNNLLPVNIPNDNFIKKDAFGTSSGYEWFLSQVIYNHSFNIQTPLDIAS